MTRPGLRSRSFRRFAIAMVLLATLGAWAGDSSCCCCDCRGFMGSIFPPSIKDVDPPSQEFLRSSRDVRRLVGAIRTIRAETTVPETHMGENGNWIGIVRYVVEGAVATATFVLYLQRNDDHWEVVGASHDNETIFGEIPSYSTSSGGGGGWD